MDNRFQPVFSSILFSAVLAATGCAAEPDDPDDPDDVEALEAEDQELEEFDDLVDEPDEARSGGGGGGGGGGCGGGCCGGGCGGGCQNDHQPPKITTKTIELWPPNHQYETIDLEDCFKKVEECDPHWTAKILWVSSDEPENGQGDGNTKDDIKCVDKDTVKLRAERQGGGDGRVYIIKWEAKDTKNNKSFGTCKVVVPHDQGQGDWAVDSGEKYRKYC
jgi:hypothetical protein